MPPGFAGGYAALTAPTHYCLSSRRCVASFNSAAVVSGGKGAPICTVMRANHLRGPPFISPPLCEKRLPQRLPMATGITGTGSRASMRSMPRL